MRPEEDEAEAVHFLASPKPRAMLGHDRQLFLPVRKGDRVLPTARLVGVRMYRRSWKPGLARGDLSLQWNNGSFINDHVAFFGRMQICWRVSVPPPFFDIGLPLLLHLRRQYAATAVAVGWICADMVNTGRGRGQCRLYVTAKFPEHAVLTKLVSKRSHCWRNALDSALASVHGQS